MLIHILYYIGVFSFYLWFVWPFLFVFCLAYGIADLVKGTGKPIVNWPWPDLASADSVQPMAPTFQISYEASKRTFPVGNVLLCYSSVL